MKVGRAHLEDEQYRKKASGASKFLKRTAKLAVQIESVPLYLAGEKLTTAQCQEVLNVANEHVIDYIRTSPGCGGVAEAPL